MPVSRTSVSTMYLPIAREAVAAGEGTFNTFTMPSRKRKRKSSSKLPFASRAWARTPDPVTYGEVRHLEEVQFSVYNFEDADVEKLWEHLRLYESECQQLLSRAAQQPEELTPAEQRRFPVLAAYDLCLKCSHLFNLLDARGAISVTERVGVIARIRTLAVGVAKAYAAQQQPLATSN